MPSAATTHSAQLGHQIATRSPGSTPEATKAPAEAAGRAGQLGVRKDGRPVADRAPVAEPRAPPRPAWPGWRARAAEPARVRSPASPARRTPGLRMLLFHTIMLLSKAAAHEGGRCAVRRRRERETRWPPLAPAPYYDPYDFDIDADPYPVWKRLRDEAPLYYNEKYDFYARQPLRRRRSAPWSTGRPTARPRGRCSRSSRRRSEMPPGMFIFEDPPDHDLHRGLTEPGVHAAATWRPSSRRSATYAARTLDPLVGHGGFDFIADLGAEIPMRTIGMLLGHPRGGPAGAPRPHRRGPAARGGRDARGRSARGQVAPSDYGAYIDWRAEHPSDDLMTELLTAEFTDETGTRAHADPGRDPRLHRPARRGPGTRPPPASSAGPASSWPSTPTSARTWRRTRR